MLSLSPAAKDFWGGIVRHLLTAGAGMLVLHGYVTQGAASTYVEELVGVILQAAVMAWSNRATYWQRAKLMVALMLPKGSTENNVIDHIAVATKDGKPLPTVLTPADTTPGVPLSK